MKRLVLALLFALCLPPVFGAGESGLSLGLGSILPSANILVLASSTANSAAIASGTNYVIDLPTADINISSQWAVSTFTSAIDQVVVLRYVGFFNPATSVSFSLIQRRGSTDIFTTYLNYSRESSSSSPGMTPEVQREFNLKAGDTLRILVSVTFTGANNDASKSVIIYRIR